MTILEILLIDPRPDRWFGGRRRFTPRYSELPANRIREQRIGVDLIDQPGMYRYLMNPSTADADSQWITRIVEQYQDRLVRYAQRIVGDTQSASDIVQDAFVKLCAEDIERLQPIVVPWLYRVCRNRALDVRKKDRRMSPTDVVELTEEAARTDAPDHAATVNDDAAKALAALSRLPENQQEVIRLRIEHGLTYSQISEVTELSASNVGYLLHVGLKTLRSKLATSET